MYETANAQPISSSKPPYTKNDRLIFERNRGFNACGLRAMRLHKLSVIQAAYASPMVLSRNALMSHGCASAVVQRNIAVRNDLAFRHQSESGTRKHAEKRTDAHPRGTQIPPPAPTTDSGYAFSLGFGLEALQVLPVGPPALL